MSKKPINPLRRRMIEDMTVRNFVEETRDNYIRHVNTLTAFLGRSPIQRRHRIRGASSCIKRRPTCGRLTVRHPAQRLERSDLVPWRFSDAAGWCASQRRR
jgi:hypothetical protein